MLTGYALGYDVALSDPLAPDWGPALLELPPGRELSGVIVDARTTEPVAAARVTLRVMTETRPAGEPDPLEGRRIVQDYTATSDEEGRYHVASIPSRAFRVIVEAEDYLPSKSDRYFGSSPDFDEDLVIALLPADHLAGTVLYDGQPVAGAQVELLRDRRPLAATTSDAQGRFRLPSAGADPLAPLTLEARDSQGRYARNTLELDAMAGDVDAALEMLGGEHELVLVDPVPLRVRVQGNSGPLAGAHVLAVSVGAWPTTAFTDAQGEVRLVHPLAIRSAPTVWLQARHRDRLSLTVRVDLEQPLPTDPIVLDVDDGGWFAGVVLDSFGAPISGATVSTRERRFTTSDVDGVFELGPAPLDDQGTTTLYAQAAGHRTGQWPESAPAGDLVLTLEPVVHWRGRASDGSTGDPLVSFQARLEADRGGSPTTWEQVETRVQRAGAPGEFSVELPDAGRYRLQVLTGEHIAAQSQPIEFDGVYEPAFTDLFLARAAVLAVRVEDAGGRPIPGYQVWLVPHEIAGERETPRGVEGAGLRHQLTDGNGSARFNLGAGGRMRLASGPGAWLDGGPFMVAPGPERERRIRVPSLGDIDLTVLDPADQPVGGFDVALNSVGATRVHSIRRQGRVEQAQQLIEVRALPAGDYELSIAHDDFEATRQTLQITGGRVLPTTIRLH